MTSRGWRREGHPIPRRRRHSRDRVCGAEHGVGKPGDRTRHGHVATGSYVISSLERRFVNMKWIDAGDIKYSVTRA